VACRGLEYKGEMVNFAGEKYIIDQIISIIMFKKSAFLIVLLCSIAAHAFSQGESRLLRFPAIHGDQVVFSYAGDLYTVAKSGGVARKLTNDPAYEMFAKFSPDGSQIAFTAQYDGNTEVYLMPASGGVPKRLTITATLGRDDISDRMGPNNIVMAWTPDGKHIIYRSRKQSFNDFKGQLFKVSAGGGMSEELPLPSGGFCSFSPDGQQLAYNRIFREFRTWKYYEGGMADDIWIYDFRNKSTVNITSHKAQDIIPMWKDRQVYFLSDRDRTMNLFVYNPDTRQTRKLTTFTDYDIKFPSLGNDCIIFEKGGYLYYFDLRSERVEKIPVTIADDLSHSRDSWKDATKNITDSDVSPDGKRIVFSARGDIFTVPVKSGITRNLTSSAGAHDREAAWSPDGKTIAYLSDKSGEYEIYIQKQDGSEAPQAVTQGADTYKFRIAWSPDSRKILWNDRMNRLQYVDIQSREVFVISTSPVSEYTQFSWSPDSKWIVYSDPRKTGMDVVSLYNLAEKKSYEVTDTWFDSGQAVFSPDGKYLYFVSARDFNPTYSHTEWNHAYIDMSRIYMVLLDNKTPSPFAPENDEVKSIEQPTENKDNKEKDTKEAAVKKDILIDLAGMGGRIVDLPLKAGNYWNLAATKEGIYYNFRNAATEETVMYYYDLKKKKASEITQGVGFMLSEDGKKMLISKRGKYYVIDPPTGKAGLEDPVNLSNMKVLVNNREEWNQIYHESWRQMRDFFYVSNMHGTDWPAMRDKYAVLLPWVNDRNDLNYVIGELIGELNVGHAYVNGGDKYNPERINLGLLGAKLSKASGGYFRINKLLAGENWSESVRSPLTEAGVDLREGDYILSVNGRDLQDIPDIYGLLINTADQPVELRVNDKPQLAGSRTVLVKPVKSETSLYYYNWVQDNIRKVSEATGGQVGYIHIPDMGVEGLNEFARYFYPQLDKKALIIDDRGNGGGNVSPMILERLQREVTRANMSRNSTVPGQTPRQMMLGPKVMLIDHYSASDGDLFPYGFKKHQIGKTIGTRTWGGVVGIRGSLPFIDGGDLRKPEFASYSAEESKWIIEGYGVDPDIFLENDPAREYEGTDDQLNKAIEVILEELKNYKPLPAIPPAPDKSK